MIYQKYTRLFGFLVLLILLTVTTSPVLACTQSPPTPWFDERLDVISSNLPDDIKVRELGDGVTLQNDARIVISIKDVQGTQQQVANRDLRISANIRYSTQPDETLLFEGAGYQQQDLPLKTYNIFADYRPTNPEIPKSQNVAVNIWVGQQAYTLNFLVSYQLNPYYRIDSVDMYENGCARFNWMSNPLNLIASVLVMLFVVLLLAGIVFSKKTKS